MNQYVDNLSSKFSCLIVLQNLCCEIYNPKINADQVSVVSRFVYVYESVCVTHKTVKQIKGCVPLRNLISVCYIMTLFFQKLSVTQKICVFYIHYEQM